MQGLYKIFSSVSDAIWSYDLGERGFAYTNSKLEELLEKSAAELRNDPFFVLDFVHPHDRDFVRAELATVVERRHLELEYRLQISGQVKWVQDKVSVLYGEDNQPLAITGIVSDVTAKKQAELSFSQSEKTFRYLFLNNPNPLWIYDRKSLKFLAINHAAVVKYGYSEREFLSMTIADIRPKEDIHGLLNSVKSVSNSFYNSGKSWRHIKKNGEIIYVDISGHGLKYEGYDAEIVMAHDITAEVESRRKISLGRKNLNALINNINDEIWSIDSNYKLISFNNAFKDSVRNVIGRDAQEGESVFFREISQHLAGEWKKNYDKALQGQSFSFVTITDFGGDKKYYLETKMSPIKNNEEIIGVSCISSNIEDKIEAQKKIVEQNKILLELLAIASHELRGPVASLIGLVNVFNTKNHADPFNAEIIKHVQDLTGQLDDVIHTLVDKTYLLQKDNEVRYFVQRSR